MGTVIGIFFAILIIVGLYRNLATPFEGYGQLIIKLFCIDAMALLFIALIENLDEWD